MLRLRPGGIRSVRRQPVQHLEAPPQEIGAERHADGDLRQLNDEFVLGHGEKYARIFSSVTVGLRSRQTSFASTARRDKQDRAPEREPMSTTDTYLAVFLGSKTGPRMQAWLALPEAGIGEPSPVVVESG